ncbi:MAG: hypothetical protein KKF74_00795 [Nanoarchaeota archaeon]|nr:hypothetical protein [Nanoarchaeota archaeon]
MAKMHTRIKRRMGLSTHLKHYKNSHSVIKISRPKTFTTEEGAHTWAAKQNLKPEQYSLKTAKHNKKFMVVVKNGKDKNSEDKKGNEQAYGASQG